MFCDIDVCVLLLRTPNRHTLVAAALHARPSAPNIWSNALNCNGAFTTRLSL